MREDSLKLEETRLDKVNTIDDYQSVHERHRIFPALFEKRVHKKILDISAGIGVVAQRIRDHYPAELVCNEVSPTCLKSLKEMGVETVSFDLDQKERRYPLADKSFDAVITLATIEHLINIDHFIREIHRILQDKGVLYISAPNYSGLLYLLPFLRTGRTFHDPMNAKDRYEFYAHVRYFTYRTLWEYVSSFGFVLDTVYLAVPQGSSKYQRLYSRSKCLALFYRYSMSAIYRLFSPRWATEPILCFVKGSDKSKRKIRKVII